MKVTLNSPIRTLSGTIDGSDLVYQTLNGRTYARQKTPTRQPGSADQKLIQSFITAATQNWDTLTALQRAAWQSYAELYFTKNADGESVAPRGMSAYVKACVTRQILGLGLATDAPTEAPPMPLADLAVVPTSDAQQYGFTLTHSLAAVTGLVVLVEITPAMKTVACTPREEQARLIKGVNAASSAALVVSGQTVSFGGARYAISDAKRFGVAARVVRTSDGMSSETIFRDLVRTVA